MHKLLCMFLFACAARSTSTTEVGVRVNKLTGVDTTVYPPAGTYFFMPFVNDWYTFSRETKRLEMSAQAQQDDNDGGEDDIEFKTRDGNDVGVDVTVQYRVDDAQVVNVLQVVATSDQDLRDKIVRPLARALVRDALNTLSSEEIYDTAKKFAAAKKAEDDLNAAFKPYGVICEGITLKDHRFHAAYQKAIVDKKVNDQLVNTNRSKTEATVKQWEAELEKAKGTVEQQIAAEQGTAQRIKLAADAYFFSKQKEAEGILAEKTNQSKSIIELNRAMASAGGRTNVKLQIAKSLLGKKIIVMPSGQSQFQKLDINDLIKSTLAREMASSTKE